MRSMKDNPFQPLDSASLPCQDRGTRSSPKPCGGSRTIASAANPCEPSTQVRAAETLHALGGNVRLPRPSQRQACAALLQKGSSILEASLETSPPRVCTTFLRIEAMRRATTNDKHPLLRRHNTPFGKAHMVASSFGLCALGFHGERATDARVAKNDFQRRWPKARIARGRIENGSYAEKIFPIPTEKLCCTRQLSLHLLATPFRLQVWRALLDIPKGS